MRDRGGMDDRHGRGMRGEREYLGGQEGERDYSYGYGGQSNMGRGYGGGVYHGNIGGYGQVQGGHRQGRDDHQMGGGYLGQGGQQMGYGREGQQMGYGRDVSQQGSQFGDRGVQNQGGLYGQGGYNEGMYGQGGMQQRYGSQGYGGYQGGGQQGVGALQGGWNQQSAGQGIGQSFRGKGPSGYVRSDERIKEIVCEVLTDHDQIDATNIEINVKNGEITLSGTVDDRRQKRLAEDAIENLPFVKDVTNQLRVGADKKSGSAVTSSGKEQEQQGQSDKRHRA